VTVSAREAALVGSVAVAVASVDSAEVVDKAGNEMGAALFIALNVV